ncbi:MAG: hypothetical protein J2P28_26385 [Actinobacteria bacterium]|nr:hypothetical protein [Actinomycetota bacterium]
MPARVHRLAVAAVRSAMWTAYYLRGVRPDRAAALDALANDLGWPTDSLRQLLAPVASEDEANARRATAIAVRYMELVRKLAANKGVRPKRISHDAIEAYRSILEKHESRLERLRGLSLGWGAARSRSSNQPPDGPQVLPLEIGTHGDDRRPNRAMDSCCLEHDSSRSESCSHPAVPMF